MKLQVGIIGFGLHAEQVVVPACSESEVISITAVATPSLTSQTRAAGKIADIKIFDRAEELVEMSELEAVIISAQNNLHQPLTALSISAGKHVLCEKPLFIESSPPTRHSTQFVVAEVFAYRHHPQWTAVQDLLAEETIGRVIRVDISYTYELPDGPNIRRSAAAAGGALNDVGCYGINAARFIFGKEPISASGTVVRDKQNHVDSRAIFSLDFGEGQTANVTSGMDLPRTNSVKIVGERGEILLPNAFHTPRGKRTQVIVDGRAISIEPANQYVIMLQAFVAAVRAQTLTGTRLEDGQQNGAALALVRRSIFS